MQRLEVSGAVRPLYGSLGVKGLKFLAVPDTECPLVTSLSHLFSRYVQKEKVNVNIKFTLEQATKVQRWFRGITLLFL